RRVTDMEDAEERAITRPQLTHSVTVLVGDPNVDSIEEDACRADPRRVSGQELAIAGAQLANTILVIVGGPDVGPVIGGEEARAACVEGAEIGAIAGTQFGHGEIAKAGDPDVCTIEGHLPRVRSDREALDGIGV